MKYNFDFSPKAIIYPEDEKVVVILFTSANNPGIKELATGYRYNNSWYVIFTNPISFPKDYKVLGWDYIK